MQIFDYNTHIVSYMAKIFTFWKIGQSWNRPKCTDSFFGGGTRPEDNIATIGAGLIIIACYNMRVFPTFSYFLQIYPTFSQKTGHKRRPQATLLTLCGQRWTVK